jgi:hypothetical protein
MDELHGMEGISEVALDDAERAQENPDVTPCMGCLLFSVKLSIPMEALAVMARKRCFISARYGLDLSALPGAPSFRSFIAEGWESNEPQPYSGTKPAGRISFARR